MQSFTDFYIKQMGGKSKKNKKWKKLMIKTLRKKRNKNKKYTLAQAIKYTDNKFK
jgi:hypothetical protein